MVDQNLTLLPVGWSTMLGLTMPELTIWQPQSARPVPRAWASIRVGVAASGSKGPVVERAPGLVVAQA